MLFPDCDMRAWEYCDNSVILANADWYYTKQQTEELIDSVSGMNPTEVQDMINRSIHSKADKTYVDEQDAELSNSIRAINSNMAQRYTKTETNNLLDMKVDKSTYSAYTATTNEAINNKQDQLISGTNIRTINGESILGSGDLVIQGGGDITSGEVQTMIDEAVSGKQDTLIAGDNITIVNNVISSTASGDVTSAQVETMIAEATNDMATETWVQNQGYLTEHQSLSAYSTTDEMNQAITAATDDMATETWVNQQGFLTEHQSLSAYSTTDEMNQAISAATDDMATETWVGNQGYITGVDLSNYATLQDIPTSNSALTNDAGYITSAALNGYATEQWVQNQGYLTEHQSLSAYSTTVEVNNAIDAAVSGKADSTAVTQDIAAATDDMATETWVQNQGYLTEHQSLSAYSTTQEMNEAISASTSGKVDTSTYTAYTAYTDTALQGKQDTLISGTNIKTINNVSILGSGNVDIQGGGNPTVEVTQAEYDALVSAGTVSADTFYIITDATAGDLSNYYTKSETDDLLDTKLDVSAYTPTDLSNYYTKSETSGATQISTALASKADTATTYTKTEVDNAITAATSTKQDTLVAGDNIIISGNVISAEGGGASYQAGRGIDITNDTISLNLPISAGTGTNSIKCGNSIASGSYSFAIGSDGVNASGIASFAGGSYSQAKQAFSMAFGRYNIAKNYGEVALGFYNNSNGSSSAVGNSSGNTLFSVGNGTNTTSSTRHNAFEIRQNGDIYCSDGTNDVKLQDTITATAANTTALGGLKLVKLSQAEYDALATKDTNTLYVIV